MDAAVVTYFAGDSWYVMVDGVGHGPDTALRFATAVQASAIGSRIAQRLEQQDVVSYAGAGTPPG